MWSSDEKLVFNMIYKWFQFDRIIWRGTKEIFYRIESKWSSAIMWLLDECLVLWFANDIRLSGQYGGASRRIKTIISYNWVCIIGNPICLVRRFSIELNVHAVTGPHRCAMSWGGEQHIRTLHHCLSLYMLHFGMTQWQYSTPVKISSNVSFKPNIWLLFIQFKCLLVSLLWKRMEKKYLPL